MEEELKKLQSLHNEISTKMRQFEQDAADLETKLREAYVGQMVKFGGGKGWNKGYICEVRITKYVISSSNPDLSIYVCVGKEKDAGIKGRQMIPLDKVVFMTNDQVREFEENKAFHERIRTR